MKQSMKVLIGIIVLAVIALGVEIAHRMVREKRSAVSAQQDSVKKPRVIVQAIKVSTVTKKVFVTGEIEALAVVDVVPKVSGRLEKLRLPDGTLIEKGRHVHKGQTIAVLDHDALDAAMRQAEAAVQKAEILARPEVISAKIEEARAAAAAAKANLGELEANLQYLKKEKDRMAKLFKSGSATEQMRDKAVSACDAALAGRKALEAHWQRAEAIARLAEAQTKDLAEADLAHARAALKHAGVNLDEATIEAPISGVVSAKFVDEGDMVGPGKALVRISQTETVKALGGVSERYISELIAGRTKVSVSVDAYPDKEFEGTVCRVGPDVDRRTRTTEVEIRISNPESLLKPGMFARMTLISRQKENVPVVPETALIRAEDGHYAFVVNDSETHLRAVKLGIFDGVHFEVVEGLKPGELVVMKGQKKLEEGDEVEVVTEDGQ